MATGTIEAGYETASITKVGNYYQALTVVRQGNLKLLKLVLSQSTAYTEIPQGAFTKVAELPVGFRPAEETYTAISLSSANTPPVYSQVQVRVYTNGDVQVYNYFGGRPSMTITMWYL